MNTYEEYKSSFTIVHAVLATTGAVFGFIGIYNTYDLYINVLQNLPFRTAHKEIGLIGTFLIIPMILWLEWQCRQQQFPSKTMLWTLIGIMAVWIIAAQEISKQCVRGYFMHHGYELCLTYYSGNKHAKNWEVWAPQGQCPANPRSV